MKNVDVELKEEHLAERYNLWSDWIAGYAFFLNQTFIFFIDSPMLGGS
jgi:hypothetical protein